jgi:transcriptional regulator with XRE-family HTH domain
MASAQKIRQVELVGRKIRQLRKEQKLTQTALAERIGVQQSDLSRMEKGEYRVSLDTLFRILAEFQMSIGEFFEDLNRESVTPRDLLLMRHLKNLDEDSRKEVEDFIEFKRFQSKSQTDPSP